MILLVMKHAFNDDLIERLPEIARLLPKGVKSALECFATAPRYVSEVSRPLTASEFEGLKEQLPNFKSAKDLTAWLRAHADKT